ncbi:MULTISPECIES: TerB family tellurite resistance protein [Flavobacterium]|uniref:TerB family tellurite resistance protein n=1 Tax=Flavobacterium TaxID=237 RepID=UPI00086C9DB7|nr:MULTISPECIES: TerB family tellurite resistance protein [Flavobacterium]MBN9285006.1 TerB family tellurite resistance protein [Flavobacterium sp.]ODS78751.1 MAG: excinuclease ABC subunit B [Chryseobacterium sp. SCN 40-13]OJV72309.1 MAG: excinuclease ABC subunit B [Flavobacterium sp. 40-81]
MNTYEERISLLSEMIAFAIVDGELHDNEYDFLAIVAEELGIEKSVFLSLFDKQKEIVIIKDEHQRIMQFYRLALLMHVDDVLHEREVRAINEIGIKMGLNPMGIRKTLKAMEDSPNKMVAAEFLICAFEEQHN